MQVITNGDSFLSSNTLRMNSLVYEVLLKFECPVIYRSVWGNATLRIDFGHEFFIPKDHYRKDEVIAFLKHELKDENYPGKEIEDGTYLPGNKTILYEFSGIEGYVDKDTVSQMAKNALEYLRNKLLLIDAEGKTRH